MVVNVTRLIAKALSSSVSKKVLLYSLIAAPVMAAPIVSTVNVVSQVNPVDEKKYYRLDNELFDSKEEAVEYIRNSEETEKELAGTANTYYLNSDETGSSTDKYNNSYDYRSKLLSHVSPIKASTSLRVEDIYKNVDPVDKAVPLKYFNKIALDGDKNDEINIYRGFKGQVYKDEESAKNSYYRVYDGYQYNDIFFRSREELKFYLRTVYFDDPNNLQALKEKYVISTHNEYGEKITSRPMVLDSNDVESNKSIEKFALDNLNSSVVYDYVDDKGQSKPVVLNSKTDIKNVINDPEVIDDIKNDLEFFKVYGTDGKSGFIVDTLAEDQAQLIGANYVETTQDVNGISNKDNWSRTDNSENPRYVSAINDTISSLMNYLAFEAPMDSFGNDSEKFQKAHWFNYSELSEDEFSLNRIFKDTLLGFGPDGANLYTDILTAAIKLEKLKNYNQFLKIPTLYSIAMNMIFDRELNYEITKTVRSYFKNVAYFLDQKLYNFVPANLLKSHVRNEYFSFISFFELDNNSVNFNQNINNVYLDKIKTDFPYFTIYGVVKDAAILNQQMFLGDTPYDAEYISALANEYVKEFFTNQSERTTIYEYINSYSAKISYEHIWNLYSITHSDDLVNYLEKPDIVELFEDLNTPIIEKLFKTHYKKFNIDSFINYKDTADWFANAATIIYYQDLNLRTKLLDFYRRIKLWESNPFLGKLYFLHFSNDQIKQIADEVNRLMEKFKQENNTAANYSTRKPELEKLSMKYHQSAQFGAVVMKTTRMTFDTEAKFSNKIEAVYNDDGYSLCRNEALTLNTSGAIEETEVMIFGAAMQAEASLELKFSDKTAEKFAKSVDVLGKSINVMSKLVNGGYTNDPTKPPGVIFNEFIRDVLDTGILDLFGPYGKVANTILSIFIPVVEDLTYTFKMDAENTWHRKGGTAHSMLFGLVNWEVGGISELKINQPISIYKNINEDRYYYNGKKYPEHAFETLLFDQLSDIQEGRITNENFQTKYFHYTKKNTDGEYVGLTTYSTPQEAVLAYKNKIFDDPTSINLANELIEYKVLDYDGDLISNVSEAIEVAIERITKESSLKPTQFIQLPNIKNGFVDFSENKEIPKFQYPITWNSVSNEIIYNETRSLLVNNPQYDYTDQIPKFIKYQYTSDEISKIYLNSFNVASKETLTSETIYTSNFDLIANNVSQITLYKTNIPSMQAKFFASVDDAMDYMLKLFNLRVINEEYFNYTYKYNEHTFNTIDEITDFVNQNAIEMTEQDVLEYIASMGGV